MATRTDIYEILGVTPTATHAELSRAYHAPLRRYHPDTRDDSAPGNGPDPAVEAIRLLVEAFAVLHDPARRTEDDRQLARRRSIMRAPASPGPQLDLLRAVSQVRAARCFAAIPAPDTASPSAGCGGHSPNSL